MQEIEQIATQLNNKLRGWIGYFELYSKRNLRRTMFYLDEKLVKWITKKYKQGKMKSVQQLQKVRLQKPGLFYHWEKGYC